METYSWRQSQTCWSFWFCCSEHRSEWCLWGEGAHYPDSSHRSRLNHQGMCTASKWAYLEYMDKKKENRKRKTYHSSLLKIPESSRDNRNRTTVIHRSKLIKIRAKHTRTFQVQRGYRFYITFRSVLYWPRLSTTGSSGLSGSSGSLGSGSSELTDPSTVPAPSWGLCVVGGSSLSSC